MTVEENKHLRHLKVLDIAALKSSDEIVDNELWIVGRRYPFVLGAENNPNAEVSFSRYALSKTFEFREKKWHICGAKVNKIVYSWLLRLPPINQDNFKIRLLFDNIGGDIANFLYDRSMKANSQGYEFNCWKIYTILMQCIDKEREYHCNLKVLKVLLTTKIFANVYLYTLVDYLFLYESMSNSLIFKNQRRIYLDYRNYCNNHDNDSDFAEDQLNRVDQIAPQNIFEHPKPSAPPLEMEEEVKDYSCKICYDSAPNLLFDSCKHIVCESCYIQGKIIECPFCKTSITTTTKIFNS